MLVNAVATEKDLHSVILNSQELTFEKNHFQENQLRFLTGLLHTNGLVSDNDHITDIKDVAILKKSIEMYSYYSKYLKKQTSYSKGCESKYIENSDPYYKNPMPSRSLGEFYYYPKSISIDDYKISNFNLKADSYVAVKLQNSILSQENGKYYIFIGKGTLNHPKIGDIRIKYEIYESNKLTTIFGIVKNNKFITKSDHFDSFYGKDLFNILFKGNKENVISSFVSNENKYKRLMHILLSMMIFIPIFKFFVVIYNINFALCFTSYNKNMVIILISFISFIISYGIFKIMNYLFY